MRAVEYFIMSIGNTCRFFAFQCTSWEAFEEGRCFDRDVSLMGYDANRFINFGGAMYLKTVSISPFCGMYVGLFQNLELIRHRTYVCCLQNSIE